MATKAQQEQQIANILAEHLKGVLMLCRDCRKAGEIGKDNQLITIFSSPFHTITVSSICTDCLKARRS